MSGSDKGFATDGEVLKKAANILDHAADYAEPKARDFENRSHIPDRSFGGVPVVANWDFVGRLADLLSGPYAITRGRMSAAIGRSAHVLRKNGDALMTAAKHYIAEDNRGTDAIHRAGGGH